MKRPQFLQASLSHPRFLESYGVAQALQLTRGDGGADSPTNEVQQVYINFCVSCIGSGTPTLNAYVDPYGNMLARGILHIESDSVEVCVVSDD